MADRAKTGDGPAGGPAQVLSAAGSHLYPGARGKLRGGGGGGAACMVEFADGSAAFGRLEAAERPAVLALDGYTTARGTAIPARRWRLEITREGDEARFRIAARLP